MYLYWAGVARMVFTVLKPTNMCHMCTTTLWARGHVLHDTSCYGGPSAYSCSHTLQSAADILCPGWAGIGLSNDKVLQSRALSYADTQRYRIGTNYQMLPINAPRCPFHNSHENG